MKKSRMVDEDLLKTDWAGKNWQNAGGTRRGSGLIGATGKKGFIINLVICLLLLGVIVYIFVSQFAISSKITPSTIQRKKNDTEFVASGYQYFLDEAGIVSNANNLKRAENNFYKKTGVIPFTYFLTAERVCSQEELQQTAQTYSGTLSGRRPFGCGIFRKRNGLRGRVLCRGAGVCRYRRRSAKDF